MKLTKDILEAIEKSPTSFAKKMSTDELEILLRKFANNYYNTSKTLVSDKAFDDIKDVLKEKDPTNSFLMEVGAPVKGTREAIKLPYPMSSFDKIKPGTGLLEKWIKKYHGQYVLSDKMDGSSAQIFKDNDGKIHFYTRGDGEIGKDITHLLSLINISKDAIKKMPSGCSVRGELIMKTIDFNKLTIKKKPEGRTVVNALVVSKTVDLQVAKVTHFVAYAILFPRYKLSEQFTLLKKYGFETANYKIVKAINEDILSKYLIERKEKSEYDLDGIVCVDDEKIYQNLPGLPDHAFAFKMIGKVVEAEVIKVEWEPSKDRYLKPTVVIKPIKIGEINIERVTAHNAEYIYDNNIGKGSIISVTRSGDVIPYIVSVNKKSTSGKPDMPDIDYEWNDTEKDIIATDIKGDTKNKVDMHIISYFFKTMGIKHIGDGIITKLVDNGYNTVIKILKCEVKDLENIEGLGTKVLTKIFEDIEEQLGKTDLAKFMAASGTFSRCMGERKLREITSVYPDILTHKWDKEKFKEKILEIHGFSGTLTKRFVDNFESFKKFFNAVNKIYNIDHLKKSLGTNITKEIKHSLDNEKIVFTGFRDTELEEKIIKRGGKVLTSVSSNTTILVHKDDAETSTSKFTKAKTLNIKIMTLSDFIKKYIV